MAESPGANFARLKYRAEVEHLATVIEEALEEPLPAGKCPPRKASHTQCELAVFLSDLHVGKATDTYDRSVFIARMDQLEHYLVGEIKKHKPAKIHVILGGDIVDGDDIYPGHATHIEVDVVQQYFWAAHHISRMLLKLSAHGHLYVPCIMGNHGRIGQKGEKHVLANWDYLLYRYMQADLKATKHIHFLVARGWGMEYDIAGKKFFLTHGDAIAGGGSPNTLMNAAIKWAAAIPSQWDVLLQGHFHYPYQIAIGRRTILGNGTMVSSDDWALRVLKQWVEPSQKVLLVDRTSKRMTVTDFGFHGHESQGEE